MEIEKQYLEWMASGDTGISSETMMHALTGIPVNNIDVPCDMADVGRCVRMLRRFPELRSQIGIISRKYKAWIPFIDCWKELERRWDECVKWWDLPESEKNKLKRKKHFYNPASEAWKLMQEFGCASRYLDGMRLQNCSTSWARKPPDTF